MTPDFGPFADPHLAPARQRMRLEHLQPRGIQDTRVLSAMTTLPREYFVPDALHAHAYDDHPLAIGLEQTISQPYMVAAMTQWLHLTGAETVLEIGTGSGYQAAILALLARQVFTIERHPALADQAARRLRCLGVDNVHVASGDGSQGLVEFAPFDRILVTCAAPAVPPALFDQLAAGGRLIAPIGNRDLQRIAVFDRTPAGWQQTHADECRFVPLIGAAGFSADSVSRADAPTP